MPTDHRTPKGKYVAQRGMARQRGIGWEFDFESWWALWQQSGKWELRGTRAGNFVMARNGDAGPYSPSNVQIVPTEKNLSDGTLRNLGKGRGWSFNRRSKKRPYRVHCGNKYVGRYATQEEAEAAYRVAVEKLRAKRT